jgi:hypothetical protein
MLILSNEYSNLCNNTHKFKNKILFQRNQKTEVDTPSLPTYRKNENYLHFNVAIVIITTLLMGCLLSLVLITSKMLEPQYMHTINNFWIS